jgi:DNA-directed RNA polymerase subunit L
MVKVLNLKITEHSLIERFSDKKNKEAQKCIEHIKYLGETDPLKFLPKKSQYSAEFELKNATCELANTLRRGVMDELYIYSLEIPFDEIKSDDKFIKSDHLKNCMEYIPIQQNIDNIEDLVISLNVKNTTDNIIKIYNSDIIVYDKKKKTNISIMSESGVIVYLHSDKTLNINNITISKDQSKTDYGKYCAISKTHYEILDVKPLEETKTSTKGESSLNSAPSHFRIGYKTHRNINPKDIMINLCNEFIGRLDTILKDLNNITKNAESDLSDNLEIIIKDEIRIFYLNNEYWTMANLISKYCYLEDENIDFVCPGIVHPSSEVSFVKIKHQQPKKIFGNAIKKIILDLNIIKNTFVNYTLKYN